MIQLSGMERNGNIGGNNSNFEDIMSESGDSDELTPLSLDVPEGCRNCPKLKDKIERYKEAVDLFGSAKEIYPQVEGGLERCVAWLGLKRTVDGLNETAERVQARIDIITKGCRGAVKLSGESDRTGKVLGILCDSPVYDPEPGATTSDEIVAIIREDSQKTKEYGESSDPSGEQDS